MQTYSYSPRMSRQYVIFHCYRFNFTLCIICIYFVSQEQGHSINLSKNMKKNFKEKK